MSTAGEIHRRTFFARAECEYLVQDPDGSSGVTVFTLHGYSMNAATMLRLTALWFPRFRIVSLQAPHPFYLDVKARDVGYSWATHAHSGESVRLHHEIVRYVMDAEEPSPHRRLLMGFSQPVGLNYRFAATHPEAVRGVIGVCGGMPKDWETGSYRNVDAALLHIARADDEVYPPSQTSQFETRLRLRARDVEFMQMPGPHRFPSLAHEAAESWVRRKFLTDHL